MSYDIGLRAEVMESPWVAVGSYADEGLTAGRDRTILTRNIPMGPLLSRSRMPSRCGFFAWCSCTGVRGRSPYAGVAQW